MRDGSRIETYSDERLHALGDRYITLGLGDLGITFEQFLISPHRYDLAEMVGHARRTYQRIAVQFEDGLEHLTCRNGTVMEPMRHHRNPKRSIAAYFNRRAR
jgi:hypothetical protein